MRFKDFFETLKIYNPEEGGSNWLSDEDIAEIISTIPKETVPIILREFGITDRKGITKRTIESFKNRLFSLLASKPQLAAKVKRINSPSEIKNLIDAWKVSAKPESNILPGSLNIQDQPVSSDMPEAKKGEFPPEGSKLADRLHWAMEIEKINGVAIVDTIIHSLVFNIGYMPESIVSLGNEFGSLMKDYIISGYRAISQEDVPVVKKHVENISKYTSSDIIKGKVPADKMMKLLDYLIDERLVRIRADELEYLCRKTIEKFNKFLTQALVDSMVREFRNQKAF